MSAARTELLEAFWAAYKAQHRKRVHSPEYKAFLRIRDELLTQEQIAKQ